MKAHKAKMRTQKTKMKAQKAKMTAQKTKMKAHKAKMQAQKAKMKAQKAKMKDQNEGPEGQNEGPQGQNEGPEDQNESPKTKMKARRAVEGRTYRRGITGGGFRVLPFYRQIKGIPVWWFAGRSSSSNIAYWSSATERRGFEPQIRHIPGFRHLGYHPYGAYSGSRKPLRCEPPLIWVGYGLSRPGWEFRV